MFFRRVKIHRFIVITFAAMCFLGCSDGRPSDAKVQLDLQEFFEQKSGNDFVTVNVVEIENVAAPTEDRLIYTLKVRYESNDEKIKEFVARQERDATVWGTFPDRRAVNFAKSINGREEAADVLFRKTGETWAIAEIVK